MNFSGNFIQIASVDVVALKKRVLEFSQQQWQGEAFHQQRHELHRDTQTIALVFDPDYRHTHPTRLPPLQELEPLIRPVLKIVADHFDDSPRGFELFEAHGMGYFVRASLVRLKAGGEIAEHTDRNFSLVHSHRVHLPVVSNEQVEFTVGGERLNMKEGALYEINNRRVHSVINAGSEDRIHLILDYVIPGEKCCCGEKLHPDTACNPLACEQTDSLQVPCVCHSS